MWRSWKIDWPAMTLALLCAAAMAGCTSVSSGIDPTGEHVFATPPPSSAPNPADERYYDNPMGKLSGDATVVLLSPRETTARVGSEVILKAGVGGADGYLQTNRRLEWTIAAGSVGNFTAVEKGGFVDLLVGDFNWPRVVSNTTAVGSTGRSNIRLNRGTCTPDDDVLILRGEGWISLTSPVEGTSNVTVMAPDVYTWNARVQAATINWVDAEWQYPPPSINPAGTRHLLTTTVTRQSDHSPCEGWRVRYSINGGPPAGFAPDGAQAVEVPVNASGQANAEIFQTQPAHGTNQICIEVIRPGDIPGAGGRRLVIDRGSTTKTWSAPDLAVAMTGPASANVGQTLTYRIELSNPGDLPVKEVAVEYDLPDGVTFLDSVPPAESAGNKLSWRVAELGARQHSAIEVRVRTEKQGSVTNCCRATAAGGLKATGCATTTVGLSTIDVRMNGPQQAAVGGEVYFEIIVTNRGQTPARNLELLDRFDPGLEHKDHIGKNAIQRELEELAAGQSKRIGVTLRATKPGRLCNSVEISGPGIATASAQACVAVSAPTAEAGPPGEYPSPGVETKPSLTVKITSPEKRVVGEMARFTIELTNTGAAPLKGLKVFNTWDPALLPKEATRGSMVEQGALTWTIDELAAGKSLALTILCECQSASIKAREHVSVVLPDGSREEDEAGVEITPAKETAPPSTTEKAPPPNKDLMLTAVGLRNPVSAGNELTYEIRVTNIGSIPYRQIAVTATLPEGMAANPIGTSPPDKFEIKGQTVRFNPIDVLQPGGSVTYRVRVRALRREISCAGRSDLTRARPAAHERGGDRRVYPIAPTPPGEYTGGTAGSCPPLCPPCNHGGLNGLGPESHGQNDRERRSPAGLALDLDPAAVIGDDPPGLREPHTQSPAGLSGGVIRIEQVAVLFRFDARPVVANVNQDFTKAIRGRWFSVDAGTTGGLSQFSFDENGTVPFRSATRAGDR